MGRKFSENTQKAMKAIECILTVNVWLDKDQLVLWKDKLPNYLSKAAVEKLEFRKKKNPVIN